MAEKKSKSSGIRLLQENEIECRVGTMKADASGCSLLLYKDARVDMRILDEVYGPMNWKREHQVVNGNLFCTISIWDSEKKEWVSKQDVGTESYTEKEKGQASDAFKRAGFNWGIGRELYTGPFIWVKLTQDDTYASSNGKRALSTKFHVKEIGYNELNEIDKLVISDEKGNVRYTYGNVKDKVVKTSSKTSGSAEQAATNIPGVYTGAELQAALGEMGAAKNRQEMRAVWSKYEKLQNVKEFHEFTIRKGKELV